MYALENLVNTVNFDLLSPTYERRLAKYGARGIAVEVPGFDRSLVCEERLAADFLVSTAWYYASIPIGERYNHQLGKSPLDTLLLMERHLEHYAYHGRSQMMVKNLAGELSDYGMTGSLNIHTRHQGHRVGDLIEYLSEEPDEDCTYMDKITAYTPLLERLEGSKVESWRNLWVSNPFFSKKVTYISTYQTEVDNFPQALTVDEELYAILSVLRPVDFSREIEWKVTQPGEQMTNTFHRLVLGDRELWYNGSYYNNHVEWGHYARPWRIPREVYSMRDLFGEEEAKTTKGLWQQIFTLNEQFEPTTTEALREYILKQGIKEADVLYLSNSLNRMQFPVFWNGEDLVDHEAYFDGFSGVYDNFPLDYWSKAYPDYSVTCPNTAVGGVLTVCGREISVAHLKGHDSTPEFNVRFQYGRARVTSPDWLIRERLRARRDNLASDSYSSVESNDSESDDDSDEY